MSRITLQRILPPTDVERATLYWRLSRVGAAMPLLEEEELDLDTYFNSFDEAIWRRYTVIDALSVELVISGTARILLWRHTRHAPPALLAELRSSGAAKAVSIAVPKPHHPRGAGRLCMTIVAEADGVTLHSGSWSTQAAAPAVRLMPVLCTHNRDVPLRALLLRLGEDQAACEAMANIVVVNNGKPGLAARLEVGSMPATLRGRLVIVEQPNLGGAGGFTRGLLTAYDAGATHVVLMDDDVALEPDSLLRARAFFALAARDVVLAGHMLDLFRPTHLYEAGALINANRLVLEPLHSGAEMGQPGALSRFLEPVPMHYGGWWFLGFPVALLDQHGWPMPCFIRGDDVEFGRRMHDAGVPQVAMAGIGIWHEPFYAKLGGWQLYYEIRNMLVLASRHLPGTPRRRGMAVLRMIVGELLIYRYRHAALLIKAAEDFLAGPGVYAADPARTHASLEPILRRYPIEWASRERVMAYLPPVRGPRSRLAFAATLGLTLLQEWMRPQAAARNLRIAPWDHVWFRVRGADSLAIQENWEIDQPLFRRSRADFRTLWMRMLGLAWRMLREMDRASEQWSQAHAAFTSEAAWRAYFDAHAGRIPATDKMEPVRQEVLSD